MFFNIVNNLVDGNLFQAAFPEAVTVGSIVRIEGKLKPGCIRFNVILFCEPSKDEALHCSFRLPQREVVRNHLTVVPSFWGAEEREGGWPIQASGEFEITMVIEERGVKISIDGKQFTFFNHRVPYSKITQVNGWGEAEVTSINFEKTTIFDIDPRAAV